MLIFQGVKTTPPNGGARMVMYPRPLHPSTQGYPHHSPGVHCFPGISGGSALAHENSLQKMGQQHSWKGCNGRPYFLGVLRGIGVCGALKIPMNLGIYQWGWFLMVMLGFAISATPWCLDGKSCWTILTPKWWWFKLVIYHWWQEKQAP